MFHAVVCLSCAAHTNEGEISSNCLCLCSSTWMRGISSPDCVDFTGIELNVVKLRAQTEPVICICDNNVVCIPLLSGECRDEKKLTLFRG